MDRALFFLRPRSQLCETTLMNGAGRRCVVFRNNKPGVNAMHRAGDVLISATVPSFCPTNLVPQE